MPKLRCLLLITACWLLTSGQLTWAFEPGMSNAGHVNINPRLQLRVKAGYHTCPPIHDLYIKNMLWGAKPGPDGKPLWVTFANSFSKKISHFLGAHWNGVDVGHVLCYYSGNTAGDFEVILQSSQFVLQPKSVHWSKVKNGIVNCNRHDINDCKFITVVEDHGKIDRQTLLNLKPKQMDE